MKLSLGLPKGLEDPALGSRLASLTLLRLVFLSILLSIIGRWHLRNVHPSGFSLQIALIALAVGFALAASYAIVLRRGRHFRKLAYIQIIFDQITWTVLVYVSGGAASGATSLYGLTALTGAILDGLTAASVAAVVGFSLYATLCALMILGILDVPPDQLAIHYATTLEQAVAPLSLNFLVIIVVTLLAGFLAERLRLAGGKLEEATVRAMQAERLAYLGKVAAGLAHELRNPLGSISASIELLRDAPALTEDDRRLCDIVHSESSRLNDLVGDMLDLARPKKPEIVDTDLAAAASDVVTLAQRSGRGSTDVKVRLLIEGPQGPRIIPADPAQLRQLVWNLVRNAVQATEPGTEVLLFIADLANGEQRFEIRDHGRGLSEGLEGHLFEAFFSTKSQGAGIGLAVVKRIADDHGWGLDVESKEGEGTTFRIVMPTSSH